MFERFTEQAIKVIMLAQEEARRLGYNRVTTTELLMGVLGVLGTKKHPFLSAHGITLKDARFKAEDLYGRGTDVMAAEIPFTADTQKAVEGSWRISREYFRNYIAPDALLAAILVDPESPGSKLLEVLRGNPSTPQEIMLFGAGSPDAAPVGPNQAAIPKFLGFQVQGEDKLLPLPNSLTQQQITELAQNLADTLSQEVKIVRHQVESITPTPPTES